MMYRGGVYLWTFKVHNQYIMKTVHFSVNENLLDRIDEAIERWGFHSRSEFFRFAAIDFLKNDNEKMPTDDSLRDHSKVMRGVKASKQLAEARKWKISP
jgi:metal-responsive CopG/Arc/MetJ family transcriptional regulator